MIFGSQVGFFNVLSKLALNLAFVFWFKLGVEGIALSTAVTSWAIFFIMLLALKTRLGELPFRIKMRETMLVIGSVAAAAAGSRLLWNQGSAFYNHWLLTGMCSVFFFSGYLLSMCLGKSDFYMRIINLVGRR